MENFKIYDVIIVGGGASGLTAGIYSSRGGLKTLLLERAIPGGLALTTDFIENYPGFPDGINGMDLMDRFRRQAQKFGVQITQAEVKNVKPANKNIEVLTDKGVYNALCLIIASGSIPKKLNVPGEKELMGRGISYCATCDGPLFKEKDVAVIGCGNSGLQEGEFLYKFVKNITFIEFLPYMTAEKILRERVKRLKNVNFFLNHTLISINGEKETNSITIKDRKTNEEKIIKVSGVFIYTGFLPNTSFLKGIVELDDSGFIITNQKMETSVPGIFAVGDVRSKEVRQIDTACGEGTIAAIMVEHYIKQNKVSERHLS